MSHIFKTHPGEASYLKTLLCVLAFGLIYKTKDIFYCFRVE